MIAVLFLLLCPLIATSLAQSDEEGRPYHHSHVHKKYIHNPSLQKHLDSNKFRLLDFFGRHFYVMKPVQGTQDIVEWVNNGHFGEGKVSQTFEKILRTGKRQQFVNGTAVESGACTSWQRKSEAKEAPLVLDIGANAGIYGLYAAALGCTTYFFDIQRVCQKWISESIHKNKFNDHAYLIPFGAGNSTSNLTLEYSSNSCHGEFSLGSYYRKDKYFSSQHSNKQTEVSIVRIDDLFADAIISQTLPQIALIKVDAEGFEPLIVAGMHDLMRAKDPNGKGIVRNAIIEIAPLRWKGHVNREKGAQAFSSTFWDSGFHKITFFVNNFKGKDCVVTDVTDLHYLLVMTDLVDGCQDVLFERTEEPT